MKKLLVLSTFLLMFGISQAQIELWLGPKAGVNIANVSDADGKSLVGIYAGAAFSVKFSERYALQPELGFSMQGASDVYGNEDLKLNYFTVGLINKLYLAEGFHVLAGPEFNFKVNNTFSDWGDDYYYDDEGNYIDESDIQPFDFAIAAGLGYDFPFGLTLEARYKQGLLDVNDFFNIDDDRSSKNQVFQIGVAYKFHLNK